MRNEFEKKGKVTSVRLTEEELIEFTEAAEKKGLTLGSYLRECARHRNDSLILFLYYHIDNTHALPVMLLIVDFVRFLIVRQSLSITSSRELKHSL